jgi:hypothetical protein
VIGQLRSALSPFHPKSPPQNEKNNANNAKNERMKMGSTEPAIESPSRLLPWVESRDRRSGAALGFWRFGGLLSVAFSDFILND